MNGKIWRKTGLFFSAAFAMDLAGGMGFTALPYLAMRLGATSLGLGLLSAARSVGYGLCTPLAGYFSDRGDRKSFLMLGAFGITLALLLTGYCGALWQLFAVSLVWVVFAAFFWPSLFGWTGDDHPPEALGRATGAVNLGWSTGGTVGALLAGRLFSVAPSLPFLAAAIPALMGVALLAPHPYQRAAAHARASPVSAPAPTRREMYGVWLGNFAIFSMIGLMLDVFPSRGLDIGVTPSRFGVFVFLLGFARSLMFLLGFRWSRRLRDRRGAMLAQVAAAGMLATVSVASSHVWLALVCGTIGLASGVTYYQGSYASLESIGARGLRSGLLDASVVAGSLVGALGGGALARFVDKRAPYVPIAGMAMLLVIAQMVLMRGVRRDKAVIERA
jgi:predicted MFS family arabinose efflux permease